jgi:hypothetical protein
MERTSVIERAEPATSERARRIRFRRRSARPLAEPAGNEREEHDDLPELREDRAGTLERMYRRGGRLARRSRRLRRLLWRVFFVLLVGTLLLGLVLALRQGPEALVARFLSVAPGTETMVVVDQLNVRAGPTVDAALLGVAPNGSEVRVTGLSETSGEYRFWPVEVEVDGAAISGWVWEGGLQPNEWTGRLGWMQDVVEQVQDARDAVASGWERLTGWLPGMAASPTPAMTRN